MQQKSGLDKNQLISFVIFSILLIASMFYFQNKQMKEEQELQAQKAKTEKVTASKTPAAPAAQLS